MLWWMRCRIHLLIPILDKSKQMLLEGVGEELQQKTTVQVTNLGTHQVVVVVLPNWALEVTKSIKAQVHPQTRMNNKTLMKCKNHQKTPIMTRHILIQIQTTNPRKVIARCRTKKMTMKRASNQKLGPPLVPFRLVTLSKMPKWKRSRATTLTTKTWTTSNFKPNGSTSGPKPQIETMYDY